MAENSKNKISGSTLSTTDVLVLALWIKHNICRVLSKCAYQCQCTEHGSIHPGLELCPQQSGSAFSCPALSVAGQVSGAGEGLADTSQDEHAQIAKPHLETPLS